jgi:hypothetical protein
MAGNHGIVVAINDENGMRRYGRRHGFSLSITDAHCDEPVPASTVQGATCSQVVEISGRKRYLSLLGIEHGVEVAAEDLLKFVGGAKAASSTVQPGVVAGLGVLLGTVAKTIGDINGVVTNPLNFSLDAVTIQDLKSVWPAITQFAGSLGIKL